MIQAGGKSWVDGVGHSLGLSPVYEDESVARTPVKGFDWSRVVVGHWLVGHPQPHVGKWGKQIWICLSACGVRSPFRADELARGATQKCEACRGVDVPPSRVAPERVMREVKDILKYGVAMEMRSNLRGKEALRDWEERAVPKLLALLDATGLGRNFGWKVVCRDAHEQKRADARQIHARRWRDETKGVELGVPGEAYWYEVDIAVGRTDKPWAEIRRALEAAIYPPEPPKPAPAPATEDRAAALQAKLGKAIGVKKDLQASAELVAEIRQRLGAAKIEHGPLAEAEAQAQQKATALAARVAVAKERVADLDNRLKAAVRERDDIVHQYEQACAGHRSAVAKLDPVTDRINLICDELAQAEREDAERRQKVEKVAGLSALLEALDSLDI
jgi:hypothetical protein